MKYYSLTRRNHSCLIDENELKLMLESHSCTIDELDWYTGWTATENNYNIIDGCGYQEGDICD